MAINEICQNIN